MLTKIYVWLRSLFATKPVKLAIVRRYADANGSYVGELYIEGVFAGVSGYRMLGMSLDTLPLNVGIPNVWHLDTLNDFLERMPPNTVRVGAMVPVDNVAVQKAVRKLPRKRIQLLVQNRFIEHVLEKKSV